jgi:hypothetical protein
MNNPIYALFLTEIEGKNTTLILCPSLPELQVVLDNMEEDKFKISIVEIDDVFAYQQWITKLEDNNFGFNLN